MKFYLAELKTQIQATLAIWLNSIGVKVAEVRVIPDVEDIIVDTLNLLRSI